MEQNENIEEKKSFSKWTVVALVILIIGVVLVISYVVYNIATANPTEELSNGTEENNTGIESETEVKCGNGVCNIEDGELVFCAEDCKDVPPPVAPVMGNQS